MNFIQTLKLVFLLCMSAINRPPTYPHWMEANFEFVSLNENLVLFV